jgi:hypothetical protein
VRELAIPTAAAGDANAFEYLRLWSSETGDHISSLVSYGSAEVWGIVLADIGREIARSLAKQGGSSATVLLDQIEAAFNSELNAQTPRV